MTPAERLRAAAARLRELAKDAAPGPWASRVRLSAEGKCAGVFAENVSLVAWLPTDSGTPPADAAWIAAMSPAIAAPLARVLDQAAVNADLIAAIPDCPPKIKDQLDTVLTLADAILGGAS